MSHFPPFASFSGKRGAGTALQQQIQLEHFTDAFIETRQGSCWVDGDNAWLLEPDERREFTARAQEIIAWRFAMEVKAKIAVMVTAPPVFMLLNWLLGTVLALPEPWPMGISTAAVIMIALCAGSVVMWQEWKLKALRNRMRLRMRGRGALPAEGIEAHKLGNPWLAMAQVLIVLTVICIIGYGLFGQSDLAMRLPLPASLTMPAVNEATMMQWSGGPVVMVWLLFGLSRIRRWRNGRKEARLRADRALAAMALPGDDVVLRHPLDKGFDPSAFDYLLAQTSTTR